MYRLVRRYQDRIPNPFWTTIFKTRVYIAPHATVEKPCREIIDRLNENIIRSNEEECDVKVIWCPIVSRAGTDIEAALSHLTHGKKPTIMFVLHHTFDPEYIVPSSSRYDCDNLMMVDVLFHEDTGLLKCSQNTDAIKRAEIHLQKFSKPQFVVNWRLKEVFYAVIMGTAGILAWKKRDKVKAMIFIVISSFTWRWNYSPLSVEKNIRWDLDKHNPKKKF